MGFQTLPHADAKNYQPDEIPSYNQNPSSHEKFLLFPKIQSCSLKTSLCKMTSKPSIMNPNLQIRLPFPQILKLNYFFFNYSFYAHLNHFLIKIFPLIHLSPFNIYESAFKSIIYYFN